MPRMLRDPTKLMTLRECYLCLQDLHERAYERESILARTELVVFQLLFGCGLRRIEAARIRLGDIVTQSDCPCVTIRKGVGKNGTPRVTQILYDDVLYDLHAWKQFRFQSGADPSAPVLVGVKHRDRIDQPISGETVGRRWRRAIRILGPERVKQLASHSGRRSFITHCLNDGMSLGVVRDAAGHSTAVTTDLYIYQVGQPDPKYQRRKLVDGRCFVD